MTPDVMQWGYKLVGVDLATDDRQGGRYRYRPGQWHQADNPTIHNNPCPNHPGDGLCVARTLAGAQSGGARLGASTMLLVGFHTADVLADTHDKVRVRRLYVHPDPLDPVAVITGPGAYLGGAYLGGAYLRGADLRGAYLRGADLRGAYLRGADLSRADLSRADLSRAMGVVLPAGWQMTDAGYVVAETS